MKFLNLVLYSQSINNESYESMYALTSEFYSKYINVTTIYYRYDANLAEEYIMSGNVLYIKGEESLIPGILKKTVSAFEYILNQGILHDYDYIIRSNISTIVDFSLLEEELLQRPVTFYGGGNIINLQWKGGGITDEKWFGTLFAQGTSIILTEEAVKCVVNNQNKIRYDIVDDVALAIFFKEYVPDKYPPISVGGNKRVINMPRLLQGDTFLYQELKKIIQNKFIFYRNNCMFNWVERRLDALQMKMTIEFLVDKII